jgi:hypothetical protein
VWSCRHFAAEIREVEENAGHVPTWVREACDQAARHRIGFEVECDDGDVRGRSARRLYRRRAGGQDDVHTTADQVRCQRRQTGEFSICQPYDQFDRRLTLSVAFAQTLAYCGNSRRHDRRLSRMQDPDLGYSRGLLPAHRQRPRRRNAAEQRDEVSPFHCPVPPVLPNERNSIQGTAALRDFEQANVADGSIASWPALAGRWVTSAMP